MVFQNIPPPDEHVDFPALINAFIKEHGDVELDLPLMQKENWTRDLKGTGSPHKKQRLTDKVALEIMHSLFFCWHPDHPTLPFSNWSQTFLIVTDTLHFRQ
jgi:hypothetical protein